MNKTVLWGIFFVVVFTSLALLSVASPGQPVEILPNLCTTQSCVQPVPTQCSAQQAGLLQRESWAPIVFSSDVNRITWGPTTPNVANGDSVFSTGPVLYVVNSQGQNLPGFPVQLLQDTQNESLTMATVGDLDNDGDEDFVVVGSNRETHENHVWVFLRATNRYELWNHWTFFAAWPPRSDRYYIIPGPLTIADLFNDGRPELVGLFGAELHVWNMNGQEQLGFPFSQDASSWSTNSAAVANLNADPELEIVTVTADGNVSLVDAYGSLVWRVPVGMDGLSPVIGDVDNDGQKEIVVLSSNQSAAPAKVTILGANGTIEREWIMDLVDYITINRVEAPTLVRLDRTPTISQTRYHGLDIVMRNDAATGYDFLNAFSSRGTLLQRWPYRLGPSAENVTALNVCNDNKVEILSVGVRPDQTGRSLMLFSHNGELLHEIPLVATTDQGIINATHSQSAAVLADIDADGKIEVVVTWSYYNPGLPPTQGSVLDVFEVQAPSTIEWGQFQNTRALTGSR